MLVQKKITTKKLAIYISTIFFMIMGTAFMLYQNNKLTAHKSTGVNVPIVFDNPVSGAAIFDNQEATAEPSQTLDINKISQNGGLNLNIFSSDKFKNLQANKFLVKEQSETGKRDPFSSN